MVYLLSERYAAMQPWPRPLTSKLIHSYVTRATFLSISGFSELLFWRQDQARDRQMDRRVHCAMLPPKARQLHKNYTVITIISVVELQWHWWERVTQDYTCDVIISSHRCSQNTNFNSNDDKQGTVQKTGWKWSVRSVSGTNITNDNDDEDKHEDDWHQCCIASAAFWLCFSSSALLHHHTYTTIIIIIIYTTFTDSSCPSPSAAPLITRSQKPSIVG